MPASAPGRPEHGRIASPTAGWAREPACYHAPMPVPVTVVSRATRPTAVPLEEYPFSDGKVLMETEPHANSIVAMRNQLQWHFETRPDVYVAGSMAVYWRRGDPRAVVAPDVFVALGVPTTTRNSYRVWDEGGVVPAFVVEVASASTSGRDARGKRATYAEMGVAEYWRFDPLGKRVRQGLAGWRLAGGCYERVRAAGEAAWYWSEVLGLELRAEGWLLRFRDPVSGQDLLTHAEAGRALQEAERRADAEAAARLQADRRAEAEAAARLQADRRAEAEAAARLQAERERDEAERERDEANRCIRELEARQRRSG